MKILERYQLAKEIVTVVGEKITGLHSGQLLVGYKDGQAQDPVTNLDELAQNMIIQSILEVFNSDQIYAEENNKQQANLDSDNLWIIDPIDGTANFMHGLPLWGISIAFAQKGQVIFGVVYCPEIQKMYEAFEGKGAFLNAKPIYVSKIDNLEHALITTGLTHQLKNQP
ncbi:MAG TPA: inositol monophosphatase family protein, partial [Thermotogota bacterium]|nr:inositol monophosphatase family protein [Thermotogota bacterium]